MAKKTNLHTPVVIVSLSIDLELLNRLDEQADLEDRTRSKMIARMIDFYLERKHFAMLDMNVKKER